MNDAPRAPRPVRIACVVYGAAVRLFPPGFRRRFGTELTGAFAASARDRYAQSGLVGVVRLAARASLDGLVQAVGERWADWRGREPGLGQLTAAARVPGTGSQGPRTRALEALGQDVRFALRVLRRMPGFSAAVILTVALGTGAATTIFAVVRGVVLRPLPFPDSERVVRLCETNPSVGAWCGSSPANVADWVRQVPALESAGVARSEPFIGVESGASYGVRGGIASPGFFRVLRVQPVQGRLFTEADLPAGANQVVIVSDRFWRRHLNADPEAVGRVVVLDGRACRVAGVLAPDAYLPTFDVVDVWKPLTASVDDTSDRSWRGFLAIGRLADGASEAQLDAQLDAARARLTAAYPAANAGWGVRTVGLREDLVGSISATLWVFQVAVGFILLIACANVAGLLLVRATARAPEFAVRASLGAGTGRLVRQLLTESLVFSLAGGALGFALAALAIRAFVSLAPPTIPRLDAVSIDGTVALVSLALVALSAAVFGLPPARQASRADLAAVTKGLRHTRSGETRLRSVLVVGELALALVLLIGAGLVGRAFTRLLSWDSGFDRAGVAESWMLAPADRYPTTAAAVRVLEHIRDAAATVPGVRHAALGSAGPLFGGEETGTAAVDGRAATEASPTIRWYDVGPGYFGTLGRRLVQGRDIRADDVAGSAPVAVVNQALVHRVFRDASPIGHEITVAEHASRIVGVVSDIRAYPPGQPGASEIFWPIQQYPRQAAYLILQFDPGTVGLEVAVQRRAAEVDPSVQLTTFVGLDRIFNRTLVSPRFVMLLFGVFASIAVMLAAVGVYGVVAYLVASRTREIGLRVTLGATPRRAVLHVMGHAARLAALGVGLGLAAALGLGRWVDSLLFGLPHDDPVTVIGSATLFALVALVASYLPARRASRIDPLTALRAE
jgi:putative ABC transport system permease protein